jgi:hypothetical protein
VQLDPAKIAAQAGTGADIATRTNDHAPISTAVGCT